MKEERGVICPSETYPVCLWLLGSAFYRIRLYDRWVGTGGRVEGRGGGMGGGGWKQEGQSLVSRSSRAAKVLRRLWLFPR